MSNIEKMLKILDDNGLIPEEIFTKRIYLSLPGSDDYGMMFWWDETAQYIRVMLYESHAGEMLVEWRTLPEFLHTVLRQAQIVAAEIEQWLQSES